MGETILNVHTFVMGTDKEAAVKVLEEAAEVYAAAQRIRECEERESTTCRLEAYPNVKQVDCQLYVDLADELADCIQICCNLAKRYCINLQTAMDRCHEKNHSRGRC